MRERVINNQAGIVRQLAKEIKELDMSLKSVKLKLWKPPHYTFLRLAEVLCMELSGEYIGASFYPRMLASVLASSSIQGIEELDDVGIILRFSDSKSLQRELVRWMGQNNGKRGVASIREANKKPRAAFVPAVAQEYEIRVELDEFGLKEVGILEVDEALEQCAGQVFFHPTALSARLPTIAELIRTLQALRKIGLKHKVSLSSVTSHYKTNCYRCWWIASGTTTAAEGTSTVNLALSKRRFLV